MKHAHFKGALASAGLLIALASPGLAHADSFTVHTTGGVATDPNYTLQDGNTSFTSGLGPDVAVTDGVTDLAQNHPDYNYFVFTTTFDLTGLDPSTASVTLQVRGDDSLNDILINGVSTGDHTANWSDTEMFTINSGFQNGINTLSFYVPDFSQPMEFAVYKASGTADPASLGNVAATPEPSSIALLGTSLLGLGGFVKRRFA